MSRKRTTQAKPPKAGPARTRPQTPARPARGNPATSPPPGLDPARHAATRRAARGAEVLREGAFAALMASALDLGQFFEGPAFRLYLARVLEEAGSPTDPIEKMLVEQTCLAHFRVAQLHVAAGQAQGVEAAKAYSAAAARLLGELPRTALALRAYRVRVPEGEPATRLKAFRAAQ
jgi:hypothetical protein